MSKQVRKLDWEAEKGSRGEVSGEPPKQPSVIDTLVVSFERSLLARDLSKHTLTAYMSSVRLLVDFLHKYNMPLDPVGISREHVEMFMLSLYTNPVSRTGQPPSSKSTSMRYRVLKLFFKWLVDIDEIPRSPMDRMSPPKMVEAMRPVLTTDQVKSILRACEGKAFVDRRDYAIVMLFIDTGLRLMEMASICLGDIDWNSQEIAIRKGKGRKARTVYFGKRTLKALDQYVNLRGGRREHKAAHLPNLWLGQQGALSDAGIYEMCKNRGLKAGVPDLYPHLWRHYFIHSSLKAGAQVGDIMRQTGHTRVEMLLHYGESAADERARESHRRLGPGDNL